ncbi:MAG: flavoprotein [Deltaproteobacteria bacterium]|nr:flavoprotein [Deltaproteobacteria bacterium]HCH66086.1 NADPH-dependent oxidoreductase [Deltaproteobacteria bacterium]
MSVALNLTVVAGTNRIGSRTLRVAHRLLERYASIEGVSASLLDLQDLPLELAAPSAYDEKPPAFKVFADAVLASDGLHVVSPEYNGGMPGILKLFIDHLPFPESFEQRPVAFTGVAAGRFGALRPVEQLQGVFGYRNAHIYPERVFIAGAARLLNDQGEPVDDWLRARFDSQVTGFVDFVGRLKA